MHDSPRWICLESGEKYFPIQQMHSASLMRLLLVHIEKCGETCTLMAAGSAYDMVYPLRIEQDHSLITIPLKNTLHPTHNALLHP